FKPQAVLTRRKIVDDWPGPPLFMNSISSSSPWQIRTDRDEGLIKGERLIDETTRKLSYGTSVYGLPGRARARILASSGAPGSLLRISRCSRSNSFRDCRK